MAGPHRQDVFHFLETLAWKPTDLRHGVEPPRMRIFKHFLGGEASACSSSSSKGPFALLWVQDGFDISADIGSSRDFTNDQDSRLREWWQENKLKQSHRLHLPSQRSLQAVSLIFLGGGEGLTACANAQVPDIFEAFLWCFPVTAGKNKQRDLPRFAHLSLEPSSLTTTHLSQM